MKKMLRLMEKAKEKGKVLSEGEAEGKKKAVHALLKQMGGSIAKKLKDGSLKKVTVASDSAEGLKEGLEMAEDKIEELSPELEEKEDESEEESEMIDSEDSDEEMSLQEIEEKIKELQLLKKSKLGE